MDDELDFVGQGALVARRRSGHDVLRSHFPKRQRETPWTHIRRSSFGVIPDAVRAAVDQSFFVNDVQIFLIQYGF